MASPNKKIVFITGGNQGIGYETAKNLILSSEDYHVILGSRDIDKGTTAVKTLQALPGVKGSVSTTQIDVTDDTSVDAAAARISASHGHLDILINNAGIVSMTHPPTRSTLRRILETNVVGALSVTESFLPLLRKTAHPPSRLIFVSSSTGSITHASDPKSPYYGPGGATEYRASKAAVNMLMAQYCARLRPEGILVFGADPGLCATNLTGDAQALRARGAVEAERGGERVAVVVRGERDEGVGRVLGEYGVSPW
ncbi:NAD(P)-binding protein [Annulohypoxylon maeteangense]|uniref:NAD(P)-binding protein n=1 Tax=Annulohypoxylon maeteangense TaxID=1927788 RepID=UPI00200777C0|nr:NAD(P)-binding protein [Annulohypoxylon maeteangense]KAI0890584.1 NAD(P)-binding protein [Annulohypoxylon maeteangense]